MAYQWHDASSEFAAGFGANLRNGFARTAEKQQQKAEKYRQKAERQAKNASRHAARARTNIRINNREWHVDPQRIDHIIAEAYDAAARGTQGAIEAVEQALNNLHMTPPPPSSPPRPPMPPYGPHDIDVDINVGTSSVSGVPSGLSERWEGNASTTGRTEEFPVDLEQERMAILRMVADGRITPEEGDMLLEAL
jgi:hypothetical protein